jgi:hypothetical protein
MDSVVAVPLRGLLQFAIKSELVELRRMQDRTLVS